MAPWRGDSPHAGRSWLPVAIPAAAILLAATVPPAIADTRPFVTGLAGLNTDDPLAFQHVRATGAQLVHLPINRASVAPRQQPAVWSPENPGDPNYDWSQVDLTVVRAVESGLTPVLLISGAPRWAQRCQAPFMPSSICDPDPGALAAFAKAAATRYSGHFGGLPRVRYWQGLNEPNLSLFFNPQFEGGKPVSPGLYRTLANAFYAAVKSVNRSNLVLTAGLGPIAVPHYTIGPLRFTRELLCMRGRRSPRPTRGNCHGGVHFDIFDIHPYTTGGPNHRGEADNVQLGSLGRLTKLIHAADEAGRIKGRFRRTPIWNTELSWDSKPPDPGGLPMPILKRWTAEALYTVWKAGISHSFWFGLRDLPHDPSKPYSETFEQGLFFRGATIAEDRPKPNLQAFRFPFVAYSRKSKGFFFWGRTPNSKRGKVVIQIRKGGHWRNATVARADRYGIFMGVAKGGYGRRKRGFVRARYRGERSVPFSLKPVHDFYQAPFGNPVE